MTRDLATEIFRNADGSTGNKVAQRGREGLAAGDRGDAPALQQRRRRRRPLEYGYVPQPHDAAAVRAAGRDAWVQKVMPLVDRARYVDEAGARLPDAEVQRMLGQVWETIATDGMNKREPGASKAPARARTAAATTASCTFATARLPVLPGRLRHGTMFDAMGRHVGGLSRDIGLVERYGPNPNAQMRLQFDLAARADGTKADNLPRSFGLRPQSYWDQLSGVTGSPQSAKIAQIGTDVRNVQTFGKLASAVISSITDVGTYVITTGYNKLPYWDAIAQLPQGRRQQGHARLPDHARHHRRVDDGRPDALERRAHRHNWSGMLAQSTMKLSLMNAWTDTLRRAFSLTMMQGWRACRRPSGASSPSGTARTWSAPASPRPTGA
jgi:hypothetical protein